MNSSSALLSDHDECRGGLLPRLGHRSSASGGYTYHRRAGPDTFFLIDSTHSGIGITSVHGDEKAAKTPGLDLLARWLTPHPPVGVAAGAGFSFRRLPPSTCIAAARMRLPSDVPRCGGFGEGEQMSLFSPARQPVSLSASSDDRFAQRTQSPLYFYF